MCGGGGGAAARERWVLLHGPLHSSSGHWPQGSLLAQPPPWYGVAPATWQPAPPVPPSGLAGAAHWPVPGPISMGES